MAAYRRNRSSPSELVGENPDNGGIKGWWGYQAQLGDAVELFHKITATLLPDARTTENPFSVPFEIVDPVMGRYYNHIFSSLERWF